jgi:hypothetical protein
LLEAIAGGLGGNSLQSKLNELGRQQATLKAELAMAPTVLRRLHPNLSELYRRKVEALHEALADSQTGAEALERIPKRRNRGGFPSGEICDSSWQLE